LYEQPVGSTASIGSPTSKITSLVPDVEGQYDINLTVSDGEFTSVYHGIVMARPASAVPGVLLTGNMLVYPNPTSNVVEIELDMTNSSAINIAISDMEGREIYSRNYSRLISGVQHFNISMNELNVQGGIYILRIQSDETTSVRKILYAK